MANELTLDIKKSSKVKGKRGFMFFLKGSWPYLCGTTIFMLLGIAASYIIPQITRFTVNHILDKKEASGVMLFFANLFGGIEYLRANIIIIGLVVVFVALLQAVLAFLRRICSAHASETVSKRTKDILYAHIQSLPFSWHSKVSTGDIIQRATQDADLIKRYVSMQFVELFRVVFMLIIGLFIMFSMNVTMTFASMSLTPLSLAFSIVTFPKISKRFKVTDEAEGALTAALQENLTGLRVVRTFGQQNAEFDRFKKQNREYVRLWHRFANVLSVFWGSGDFFASAQTLVILVVGAHLASKGEIEAGDLLAFISYNGMLIWPIRSIGRILAETSKARISLGRLNEILDAEPEVDLPDEKDIEIKGEIEFKNVWFSYDGERNVLEDVSFKIKKGTTFGVIGATGSGKSTVASLVGRLYDTSKGEIFVDGQNIKSIKRSCLRTQIGLILQEPFLFSKVLKDNVTITLPDYDCSEIDKYLKIASLDTSIEGFEKGLDTMVGERGVTLSGGQKQRLAIARTLISKPSVVIFDDSLSAVDTETDLKVRRALKENLNSTTTILITHRISSVLDADQVVVLKNGRVEAIGTHSELLLSSPTYKGLYELQSKREEDELL